MNLAPEDARDLRFDLLFVIALGSIVSSEEPVRFFLLPVPKTERIISEAVLRSGLRERVVT